MRSVLCIVAVAISGCVSTSDIQPIGDDRYVITGSGVLKTLSSARERAVDEATKFCDKQGGRLNVLNMNDTVDAFGEGSGSVMFRCELRGKVVSDTN